MVYAIIIVSAFIAVLAWINYRRTRWWLYLFFTLVWLAWTAIYIFVAFSDPRNYDTVWFSQTFIRPLILITFGLVASILLYRLKNG